MASRVLLLVALLGVFSSQNANAVDLNLPYDSSIYRQMLSGAPWYSYCDLPWLNFYEPGLYEKFYQIAQQYNIRLSDVYQYHTILDMNIPNLSYSEESNILQATAAELRKELDRRGIYNLPSPPSCKLNDGYPQYPVNPSYPTVNPSIPVIAKRSPVLPVIPDNYPMPDPSYPYSTDITPSSYDYSLAYKNLYTMLDQYMPYLPRSVYENIKNTILNNTPPEYQHLADDVASQLSTNIRYTVGMAQQRMPPFYYY